LAEAPAVEGFLEKVYGAVLAAYRMTETASLNLAHAWDVVLSVCWSLAKFLFCLSCCLYGQVAVIPEVIACFERRDSTIQLMLIGRRWSVLSAVLTIAIGESIVVFAAFGALHSLFTFRLFAQEESSARFTPIDEDEVDTVDPLHF
jgi:hypothetical protein